MRISDWSSDVCSSDLRRIDRAQACLEENVVIRHDTNDGHVEGAAIVVVVAAARVGSRRVEVPFRRPHQPVGYDLAPLGRDLDLAGEGRQRQRGGEEHGLDRIPRSEEHTPDLQSLMTIPYAGFCLKK